MADPDILACQSCGQPTHIDLLDAKPESTQFRLDVVDLGQINALRLAGDRGDNFERLECRKCYGPGWLPMKE